MTMSDGLIKAELSQLPNWVQEKIKTLGVANPEEWIQKKIPALRNRSIIDTIHSANGDEVLTQYFAKVTGRRYENVSRRIH
jgi:hypothetical protein